MILYRMPSIEIATTRYPHFNDISHEQYFSQSASDPLNCPVKRYLFLGPLKKQSQSHVLTHFSSIAFCARSQTSLTLQVRGVRFRAVNDCGESLNIISIITQRTQIVHSVVCSMQRKILQAYQVPIEYFCESSTYACMIITGPQLKYFGEKKD